MLGCWRGRWLGISVRSDQGVARPLILLLLIGCSATKEIASSAAISASAAHEIAEQSDYIAEHSDQGDVVASAVIIRAQASVILHESNQISVAVSGVRDITPAWMSLLMWLAGSVIAVAAIVLIWQTGIGSAIRIAIGWIPRRKLVDAELAQATLDENNPVTMREYIAARRASDPLFDAAWGRSTK